MRPLLAVLLASCLPLAGLAQSEDQGQLREVIGEMIQSVESKFACQITMHGEPRLDTFLSQWSVKYSASGDECDEASQELSEQRAESKILFFRRPNLSQLRVLVGNMTRSIDSVFSCHITVRGEPRLNETSSQWFVSYLASGNDCDAASQELRRQGAELEIHFLRRPDLGLIHDVF